MPKLTTNDIRQRINSEEFDYQMLVSVLKDYASPRMKIKALLDSGDIIRVKKGIYIFGDSYRRRAYSKELLANWIYGPSLVSLEYMLSYYGLIPERVFSLTSTTIKRPKSFLTPVGHFIYRQVPISYNWMGITRIEDPPVSFLAASPERSVADKILHDVHNNIRSLKDAEMYLFEDLRIDQNLFSELDPGLLAALGSAAGSRKIDFCAKLLRKMQ